VIGSNDRVAFPVPHVFTILDVRRPLAQRWVSALGDPGHRHSAFSFASGSAGSSKACRHWLYPRIHAGKAFHDSQAACPRSAQGSTANRAKISLTLDPGLELTRIAAALRATQRQLTGLLRPIATAAFVAAKLTTDRGLVAPKLISNLCDGLVGFHEAVNLISFDLAEVIV
jgi:hypothetical protein